MATIVEFALKEEPLDVEKMRKCLLKQVIRSDPWKRTEQRRVGSERAGVCVFLVVAGEG